MRVTLPLAATAEPPSEALVVLAGILALLITVIGWPMLTHVITIAHEGGHATAASLSGGRVVSVRLDRDGGGKTTSEVPKRKSAAAFVGAAGYAGSSVFGLLGSFLLMKGQFEAVLWVSLVLVCVLLLNVVNLFGWVSALLSGILLFVVARYAPGGFQELFAVTWVWFLLFGGYGDVLGLRKARRALKAAKKPDETDAGLLGKDTWLPAPFWVALFWLFAVAALILGAGIMLGMVFEPPPAPAAPTTPTPT